MNITYKLLLLLLLLSLSRAAEQNFTQTYNSNIYGNIKMIGNTMLEPDTSKDRNDNVYFLSDDEAAYGLNITNGEIQWLWTGVWTDISSYHANNFTYLRYINIDNDGNASVYNSSSSTLTLPSNSKIVFARVYWSGIFHNSNTGNSIDSDKDASKTIKIKASTIDLGNGADNFIDITVNQTNTYAVTEGWSEIYTQSNNLYYSRYSAYKDIDLTAATFDGSAVTFTVGNIKSNEGWMRNFGNYGAWSLVVIYENSAESFKNVSLHTGYKSVFSNTLDFTISNFLTPLSSSVTSQLSVFAVEGEKTLAFGNDYMKVADNTGTLIDVSNATVYPNKDSNIFDSTITNNETKTPNIANTMGIDIDTFDIGVDGDNTHPQIIGNAQTSTTIELSSNGDAYTVNALALSTEVFVPSFCYDYSYKQYDRYFTEDNNGSVDPKIVGSVSTSSPVGVTVFIRNLIESDIPATDMNVSIYDINTTQATYIDGTTQLAKIGDTAPITIAVTSTDSYINNILVGTVGSSEHFYIYYNLDPQTSSLDMPLNVRANYNLTINGTTTPYTLTLGSEIPLCSSSNFVYTPVTGIFNVVHNNYYPHNDGNSYYNLPTQVTKREGNFKVIALNENDHNLLDGKSTIVAIELIDVAAFHDTYTSCQEQDSAISERIWVNFDNNSSSTMFTKSALQAAIGLNNTITNSSDFYSAARENTAFRISYNVDQNDASLVQTEELNGEYKILNFSEIVQVVGDCVEDVIYPLNANNNGIATRAAQACGNSGNFISKAHLQACMECIYGYDVRRVCSRDNFSIRPEAFLMNIDDQDQSNNSIQARLTTNYSGVTGATAPLLNIAAGYDYNIEVNATNHLNNEASSGYSQSFGSSSSESAQYIWDVRTGVTANACNDENNQSFSINLTNGLADTTTSLDQVGEYKLNIKDTSWTTVDNSFTYMSHHTSPYFLVAQDCVLNTSDTQAVNSATNNGCEISSNHTNNSNSLIYNDFDVTFHPYSFDLSDINSSIGLNNDVINANSYIYMADLSVDKNMSYHIVGNIRAAGENNASLSNFVTGCYAKSLDLNLSRTNTTGNVAYQYRINDSISTDINNTNNPIVLGEGNFTKVLAGSASAILNLNFARDVNASVNPESITFNSLNAQCSDSINNCTFTADTDATVVSRDTNGTRTLNNTVKHYYGRTNSPRGRFQDNAEQQAFIYYEVFCDGAGCDKSLLQGGTTSVYTDDPRWFINTNHNSGFGTPGSVVQKGYITVGSGFVYEATATPDIADLSGNHPDYVRLDYNGNKGNPYKTTMENNASNWLIYNKYDSTDTKNEFEVEFEGSGGDWAGEHQTSTTTNPGGTQKVNRRSMW